MMSSCKPELPDGVISEGKMEDILYDYHMAQGMADAAPKEEGYTNDMLLYEFHQAVFDKYGITEAEFDSSMSYYCSDLDRLSRIYSHVSERLEKTAEAYGVVVSSSDGYNQLSAMGDTANVWSDRPLFVVKPDALDNLQSWQMECDTTWHPGDDVMWRFECSLISKAPINDGLYFDIVVTYTNDSVRAVLNSTRTTRDGEVRVHTPYDWTPRTVTGHLFVPVNKDVQASRLFVVHHPMLIRFHKHDVKPDPSTIAVPDSVSADSISADTLAAPASTESVSSPLAGTTSAPAVPEPPQRLMNSTPREHRGFNRLQGGNQPRRL